MSNVNPTPPGLHTVTPALTVDGAADAIEFYKAAFGAEEVTRAADPSGKNVWHATIRIGTSWTLAQHVKDMTPGEMKAAQDAFLEQTKH